GPLGTEWTLNVNSQDLDGLLDGSQRGSYAAKDFRRKKARCADCDGRRPVRSGSGARSAFGLPRSLLGHWRYADRMWRGIHRHAPESPRRREDGGNEGTRCPIRVGQKACRGVYGCDRDGVDRARAKVAGRGCPPTWWGG